MLGLLVEYFSVPLQGFLLGLVHASALQGALEARDLTNPSTSTEGQLYPCLYRVFAEVAVTLPSNVPGCRTRSGL